MVVGVQANVVSQAVREEVESDSGFPDFFEVFFAVDCLWDDTKVLQAFDFFLTGVGSNKRSF